MAKKSERKTCFVVGPIGDDDSDDRIHADWLLEDIIQPVFKEHFEEFDVLRADTISNPGQITTQIITALLESDLVIADLTTLNPNAFYEIGIRHTVQKPIIHMHLEGQRIPFDIAPFRSLKFSRKRPSDIRTARQQLLLFIKEALNPEHEINNPVTFSRGKITFDESATPREAIIEQQLEAMLSRLKSLEASQYVDRNRKAVVDALLRKSGGPREEITRIKVSARSLQSARQMYDDVEQVASSCFDRGAYRLGHQMESDVEIYVSDDGGTSGAMQTFAELMKLKGYAVDFQTSNHSGSLF